MNWCASVAGCRSRSRWSAPCCGESRRRIGATCSDCSGGRTWRRSGRNFLEPHADLSARHPGQRRSAGRRTPARAYLALAVMLEDMPAAPALFSKRSGTWTKAEALETAEQFVEPLAGAARWGDGGIRLHDLQLDYVRAQSRTGGAGTDPRRRAAVGARDRAGTPRQFASQMVGRLLPYRISRRSGSSSTSSPLARRRHGCGRCVPRFILPAQRSAHAGRPLAMRSLAWR